MGKLLLQVYIQTVGSVHCAAVISLILFISGLKDTSRELLQGLGMKSLNFKTILHDLDNTIDVCQKIIDLHKRNKKWSEWPDIVLIRLLPTCLNKIGIAVDNPNILLSNLSLYLLSLEGSELVDSRMGGVVRCQPHTPSHEQLRLIEHFVQKSGIHILITF